MISPRQYVADKFPWLTSARAMAGAFGLALLIVFIWPYARLASDLVIVTAIPGSIGAIVWGLTFSSKARVQIGRLRLRYKSVRRIVGIVAIVCLPFLLMQQASIYLRGRHRVGSENSQHLEAQVYVAVAHFEGDDGHRIEKRLLAALGGIDRRLGVIPLTLDTTIAVSGRAQGFQHIEAVASINDERVGTLIWGGVKGVSSPAIGPLYCTSLFYSPQFGGVYLPVDFKLPELPLSDLSPVLQLVIAAETADGLARYSYKFGDALEPFIKQVRTMANDPHRTSGWSADTRARINLILGIALKASAIELRSEDEFNEAISYLEKTQTGWTRDKNPLEWAMVQQSLAAVKLQLSYVNLQPGLLNQSLSIYQSALAVYQAHSDEMDATNVQYEMGDVFRSIANHETGTDNLRRAAECYRIAIKGYDIKRYPRGYAAANLRLGTTLNELADREGNPKEYEEAIPAFREALKVYNWGDTWTGWVDAEVQLAESLQMVGAATSNVDDLKQAIAINRKVLDGFQREWDPQRWAGIQAVLGNELLSLNDIQPDPAYPQQAAVAFRASLEQQSVDRDPLAWAANKAALGNALAAVGDSTNETDYFQQAIDAFNDALKVYKPDRDPVEWARAKSDLADALSDLGMRGPGVRYLTEAVDDYHQALTVLTKDKLPDDWKKTQNNLGIALDALHQRGWPRS